MDYADYKLRQYQRKKEYYDDLWMRVNIFLLACIMGIGTIIYQLWK